MTPDATTTPSSGEKLQMYADNHHLDDKHALKSRLSQVTSYLYPALLALLLIVGTTLLVITVTRRNTCRQLQDDRIEPRLGWLSKDHVRSNQAECRRRYSLFLSALLVRAMDALHQDQNVIALCLPGLVRPLTAQSIAMHSKPLPLSAVVPRQPSLLVPEPEGSSPLP